MKKIILTLLACNLALINTSLVTFAEDTAADTAVDELDQTNPSGENTSIPPEEPGEGDGVTDDGVTENPEITEESTYVNEIPLGPDGKLEETTGENVETTLVETTTTTQPDNTTVEVPSTPKPIITYPIQYPTIIDNSPIATPRPPVRPQEVTQNPTTPEISADTEMAKLLDFNDYDEVFMTAFQDFESLKAEFEYNDEIADSIAGTSLEEVNKIIDHYFENNDRNMKIEALESETGKSVLYQYYAEEDEQQASPLATLRANFYEDKLTSFSVFNLGNVPVTPAKEEDILYLRHPSTTFDDLLSIKPSIVGITHKVNDQAYDIVIAKTGKEDNYGYGLFEVYSDFVLYNISIPGEDIDEPHIIAEYINEIKPLKVVNAEEKEDIDSTITEEGDFVASLLDLSVYDQEKLLKSTDLASAVEEVYQVLHNKEKLTADIIKNKLPTVTSEETLGSSQYLTYVATDSEILNLLTVTINNETSEVEDFTYEYYTPNLNEAFNITMDELEEIVKGDLNLEKMSEKLGSPNNVFYISGTNNLQYNWLSNNDDNFVQIQLYYDLLTEEYQLYYIPTE